MSVHLASIFLVICNIIGLDGFDLQCTIKTTSKLPNFGPTEKCRTSNLQITSRGQTVTSVNGQDLNTFNGSNFKTIEIGQQTVHFLPNGLGNFFPNLEEMRIDKSSLKEVNKDDLAQLPKLKQLWLFNNDFQSLPSDLFEGNSEL